jgi:Flp pilus assembly protein TadD
VRISSGDRRLRARALGVRAKAHLELEHMAEVVADATEAIEIQPRNPGLYFARAAARGRLGQCDEANADFCEGLRQDANHAA